MVSIMFTVSSQDAPGGVSRDPFVALGFRPLLFGAGGVSVGVSVSIRLRLDFAALFTAFCFGSGFPPIFFQYAFNISEAPSELLRILARRRDNIRI